MRTSQDLLGAIVIGFCIFLFAYLTANAWEREMRIQDELNRQWASGVVDAVITQEQMQQILDDMKNGK